MTTTKQPQPAETKTKWDIDQRVPAERCGVYRKELKKFGDELAEVGAKLEKAKNDGDVSAIRELRAREKDLHDKRLTLAGDARKWLSTFDESLGPEIGEWSNRLQAQATEEKAAQEKLNREYQQALRESSVRIDNILGRLDELHKDYQACSEISIAMTTELKAIIRESAEKV